MLMREPKQANMQSHMPLFFFGWGGGEVLKDYEAKKLQKLRVGL